MTKTFPTLYGTGSTGKVKVWTISVTSEGEHALINLSHGQLGGKIQSSSEIVKTGKNIGRANETTPFEQACDEARSRWKKKTDVNYTETIPESDEEAPSLNRLPMLAHPFKKRKHNLVYPAFVQPKLNGIRCLVKREGDKILYTSRKYKPFKNLSFMDEEMLSILLDQDEFDGELYNHGEITFQELCSLIKNEKNPDWDKLKRYVQFWNYDVVSPKGFKDRRELLLYHGVHIRAVPTYVVNDERAIEHYHAQFTDTSNPNLKPYEGTIIRSGGDEPYRYQYRSPALLKYKDFIDEEFEIVGGNEGRGKDAGQCVFVCQTKDGKRFDVRDSGPNRIREEEWQHLATYIGKQLTVRYKELSDDGIPVGGIFGLGVRDYE